MKTRWFLVCATILGATVLLRADVTVPKSTEGLTPEIKAAPAQAPAPADDPYLDNSFLSTSAPERAKCSNYTYQCKDVGYGCGPWPGACICAPGPPIWCAGWGG